ncbi:DUF2252 domain-containing protein [Runella slithyformis]|uniref:DUF2252 domain-containing protein n=1 Tax=Runella slithyformis (strain ATCC 29530 / DSM 19594 / LMG 11500 / NCIMB 11436 / LSU 4) TaxID=761193 RepID=A0A7U4E667_RUNSL|nr:DUF2252 family protein [Runella slithyformis]AEI49286.1 Protein of unknown function DUF2252 [Runella slithyformis DSM 19594]
MNAIEHIKHYNAGRNALLLAHKYERMTEGLYRFFRATSHLFYADLAQHFTASDTSRVWGCGDLHLQNFGTYKAENRLVYFDMNDFDEAMLLPITWELSRMLVSIHLATEELDLEENESATLIRAFLDSYTKTLATGKPIDIERRTATGMLQVFMEKLEKRRRKDLIKERTVKVDSDRKLNVDNEKVIGLSPERKAAVETMVMDWQQQHPNPFFKRICDVGLRVTGTASLGLERYVLLVESPNEKLYLLDLKEARHSVLKPYIQLDQPFWPTEAQRIVEIQRRVNNVLPTLFNSITYGPKSYVLKELQPEQDKFDFNEWDGELETLETLIRTMGTLTASGHLRSAGRQGSSIADELIAFAQESKWQQELIFYCQAYPTKVHQDYFDFCEAYEEGFFEE